VNSPEDGPVGPKHVEIQQYINKIEIVTSVGFIPYVEKVHGTKSLKLACLFVLEECLLLFCSESFIFQLAILKYKGEDIQNYNFCLWLCMGVTLER
jgi:hypothetical protein